MDPSKWTIKLFHDPTGTVIANTVIDADSQILKPTGDNVNNTAAANRRAENIQYVSVSIQVDLSSVTKDQDNKLDLSTVIKLPMENKIIKDGHGNDIVVHTFQGKDDIRTYTVDEWAVIMELAGQSREACSLKAAAFGNTQVVLETVKTEAEFKERVVENCMSWIKHQIFDFLCPGLAFCPEQALQSTYQAVLFRQQWQ